MSAVDTLALELLEILCRDSSVVHLIGEFRMVVKCIESIYPAVKTVFFSGIARTPDKHRTGFIAHDSITSIIPGITIKPRFFALFNMIFMIVDISSNPRGIS